MSPDDLDRLFAAAERGGEDRAFLDRAARELLEQRLRIADLERLVDRRRLATLETGRSIERLRRQGVDRAAACSRLGISTAAYHRALRALRDSRNSIAVKSPASQRRNPS